MSRKIHDIQGFAVALDHVLFVTAVFEASGEQGWQFNIRFSEDVRLTPKFATRHEAELEREVLLKALRDG